MVLPITLLRGKVIVFLLFISLKAIEKFKAEKGGISGAGVIFSHPRSFFLLNFSTAFRSPFQQLFKYYSREKQ
jgi:hypothetical protein